VLEPEVHALFGATHDIGLLERDGALEDFPRFAQRGVESLSEAYFRLVRR
jgi:hypothetical protein